MAAVIHIRAGLPIYESWGGGLLRNSHFRALCLVLSSVGRRTGNAATERYCDCGLKAPIQVEVASQERALCMILLVRLIGERRWLAGPDGR